MKAIYNMQKTAIIHVVIQSKYIISDTSHSVMGDTVPPLLSYLRRSEVSQARLTIQTNSWKRKDLQINSSRPRRKLLLLFFHHTLLIRCYIRHTVLYKLPRVSSSFRISCLHRRKLQPHFHQCLRRRKKTSRKTGNRWEQRHRTRGLQLCVLAAERVPEGHVTDMSK